MDLPQTAYAVTTNIHIFSAPEHEARISLIGDKEIVEVSTLCM